MLRASNLFSSFECNRNKENAFMYDVCKQLPTNVNIGNLTNLVGKITIEVFVKAFRSFTMQTEDAVSISYFLDF